MTLDVGFWHALLESEYGCPSSIETIFSDMSQDDVLLLSDCDSNFPRCDGSMSKLINPKNRNELKIFQLKDSVTSVGKVKPMAEAKQSHNY